MTTLCFIAKESNHTGKLLLLAKTLFSIPLDIANFCSSPFESAYSKSPSLYDVWFVPPLVCINAPVVALALPKFKEPYEAEVPSAPALNKTSPTVVELLTDTLSLIIFVITPSVRTRKAPPVSVNPSDAVVPLYCENWVQVIFVVPIVIAPLFVHTQPVSPQTIPSFTIQKTPFLKSVLIASVVLYNVVSLACAWT